MSLLTLQMRDGDYVPDNMGGLIRLNGVSALLQEILFRLTARRGAFPFLDTLGSQLWRLGTVSSASRQAAARQYAAEALSDLDGVTVTDAVLESNGSRAAVTVYLSHSGQNLSVTLALQ